MTQRRTTASRKPRTRNSRTPTEDTGYPSAPPLTVLLDPSDDVAVIRTAMAAHHPSGGRITVHPSPQPHITTLAVDVLTQLGEPPAVLRIWASKRTLAWPLVAGQIQAMSVSQLVLLRADSVNRWCWNHLLDARRSTGLHVVAICHQPALPVAMKAALQEIEHTCFPAHSPTATLLLAPATAAVPTPTHVEEAR